jgi:hypothetical protein
MPGKPASAGKDAAYFVAWLDRVIETTRAREDFNDEGELKATLDYLNTARARYVALQTSSGEKQK